MVIYIKELFKGLEALRLALRPTWSTPALQLQWETRVCFSSYFEVPHPRVCLQLRALGIASCWKQVEEEEGRKGGSAQAA